MKNSLKLIGIMKIAEFLESFCDITTILEKEAEVLADRLEELEKQINGG
jgi:ubiquinone biosynthesis protein UbiJ